MYLRKCKRKDGMTLLELLLVVFILLIGIVSTLLFFTSTMLLTNFSRDITVATTHGEYILEEMQTKKSLSDIVNTNWVNWASTQGLTMLPQETIDVSFPDPTSNPLDVGVTISWIQQKRTNKVELYTKFSR